MPLIFQPHSPKERPGLGIMKHTKPETRDSSNKSVSGTITVSESKQTTPLVPTEVKDTEQAPKPKAKPFPPCTHCGFNDHIPDDCKNYPECEICESYHHSTSGYNRVIQIRGGRQIREPIWYLDNGCSRSMTGVKSYLHKYVEQPDPKDKPCTTCEKGKHHRASFKTKQNFSIRKCLHLLHMDLFGQISPMSINHEKYTLVIVDEYSRYTWVYFLRKKSQTPEMIMSFIKMVENQNDIKVKQIKTDNGTEFRNYELESFYDEKGIYQNFSSPYTPGQNGVAERKNRTLIDAARTMLKGSVLSKHFWTDAVRIACYTQNRSIIVKRHDKTSYEIFRERITNISYFHVFGCPVFIHNHKDHLGKFNAKADDGYFLGYSFVSKVFRVYNTRRQQIEETYHVTFDEKNHVPEVIAPNEPEIPHTEDTEGPPEPINTKGTHKQNVQNDQMITQPTDVPSGNNTKDRWSRDQHIELLNIIGDPGEGILTRSMAAKLIAASANECLFANFLFEIEPKKVSEALKHPGWIDAM
ncbi:retrovirus-related pol polyprotein from transposon TNT 1-94 [Tanacetum coccineum]